MLRSALPRYRPRYTAVAYLVTDPTPAWASDPLFAAAVLLIPILVMKCLSRYTPA